MTAKHIRRIQFYTRKAADCRYGERPPSQHRINRLRAYQQALSKRLAEVGYRWRPRFDL